MVYYWNVFSWTVIQFQKKQTLFISETAKGEWGGTGWIKGQYLHRSKVTNRMKYNNASSLHWPGYDSRKSTTWRSTPHLWPNMTKCVFVCTHLWIWGQPGREADTVLRQMEDGKPQETKSFNANGQYVNLNGLIRTQGLIMIDRSKAQLPACPHQPDVWLV